MPLLLRSSAPRSFPVVCDSNLRKQTANMAKKTRHIEGTTCKGSLGNKYSNLEFFLFCRFHIFILHFLFSLKRNRLQLKKMREVFKGFDLISQMLSRQLNGQVLAIHKDKKFGFLSGFYKFTSHPITTQTYTLFQKQSLPISSVLLNAEFAH